MIRTLEKWRLFLVATYFLSAMIGAYVEVAQKKGHSWPVVILGAGLFGVVGASTALFRHFKLNSKALQNPPVWAVGPVLLMVGGWLLDFRHGLVLTHQYGNCAAFATGGLLVLIRLALDPTQSNQRLSLASNPRGPAGRVHALRVNVKTRDFKPRPRRVKDLSALVRELALAMNQNRLMSARQRRFVEEHLAVALTALAEQDRHDKAARLCRRIPVNMLNLEHVLDGFDADEALKVAAAAYRQDDWGTALRLLDWAYSTDPRPTLANRILTTARIIAEQVSQLDDTFEAKIVVLRLSHSMIRILKSSISRPA